MSEPEPEPEPRPIAASHEMQAAILGWYDASGRTLPFRATSDPYAILVSEVMAQQTQIGRVAEAWTSFTATFPSIKALAAASPADVLRAWRGLGYNRRALNLWRAARVVVAEHDGRLSADVEALERLPGIGPYTARAVAAIAFGAPVGAVDTNVRRVLGRALIGDASGLGSRELQAAADRSVPPDRAADWTHALMDVGATFCRPLTPLCDGCPARPWCKAAMVATVARSRGPRRDGRATRRSAPKARVRQRPASAPAFSSSSRWLRGRILDRLRDATPPGWARFGDAMGTHDDEAVNAALTTLAMEGLLELDPADPQRARLPHG
jgi:A/G-specific adenine glycosylase